MAFPLIVIGETMQARVYCKDGEQESVNTLAFLCTITTGVGVTTKELADRLDVVLGPAFKVLIANSASYRGVGVKSLTAPVISAEVFGFANQGAGTAGAVGMPRQTSGLLSFYDGLAGRRHHGRIYLPFPAAASNDDPGVPSAAYQNDVDTLAILLGGSTVVTGAGGTATFKHVIWHKSLLLSTNVESYFVRDKWATTRRRGSYGRPNAGPI